MKMKSRLFIFVVTSLHVYATCKASAPSAQESAAQAQVVSLYSESHASDTPLVQAIKQRINRRKESDLIILRWLTASNETSFQEALNRHISARNFPVVYPSEPERMYTQATVDLRKKLETARFLKDQLPTVNIAIASDKNINKASDENHKRTAVMLASAYGDLPVVQSLLERPHVDVLGHDAFGKTARDLAYETSGRMFWTRDPRYKDDCGLVIKLLNKRELGQRLQERFVDDVNRRHAAELILSPQQGEQSLPLVLSNIVGEYIIPQIELPRSNQPASDAAEEIE
ncbi:MAG: ankyrin repeat domain-containing protein [Candidatus Babeliales bacterium]|nr:ankyrin repeat domain-containing protein [Candidatus Babeliales bacterium]